MKKITFLLLAVCLAGVSCTQKPVSSKLITNVDFTDVSIEDSFWSAQLKKHKEAVLPTCITQIEDSTGRMQNFINAGKRSGRHSGIFFDDSDVYKALEGIAYSLAVDPDPALEAKADEWIGHIASAQLEDGYINTFYTLTGLDRRWTDMDRHEMYCAGHLIEAGVAWLGEWISTNLSEGPLKDMLIDGIIGGVGGVIVFLPNILILYFFISLMEDSGYMARAAFIMDKIMHKMGLHGKSFIPLIMGFGCNVPAIMASRTIENRKSRLVTMLINPLMSCSARLPIYLLLTAAFFPEHASLVLLSIYAIGIVLAILMARLFCRFLVKGDDTPFVMELPPYRLPTSKAIFRHTWEKGAQYLRKMGGIIMVASIVIWALGYYPHHAEYETVTEQQENSYIGRIGKAIEPVIEPLGFDWKLGVGILSGVGAKELVVSTLGVLYADDAEADSVSLGERIPITPLVAFAYMVFVLIYFPCIATLAAIKGETGSWKWPLFAAGYTTALAWLVSFAIYQIGGLFL